MKFILQGDLHIRSTTPVNRVDNYFEAQISKFIQLLNFAEKHKADILCGGDFFDKPEVGFNIYNAIQDLLQGSRINFFTCVGNHDIYYHNQKTLKATALYGLRLRIVDGTLLTPKNIMLHGVGWEQKVTQPGRGKFNILMAHIPVFENQIPFYWKGEGFTSKTLKERYPGFDLYFCSDIHVPFIQGNVVVSGSMMRQSIDQMNYKPRCYLIETDTMEITPLYYEIKDNVFNIPDEKIKENLELTSLVEALKVSAVGKASFPRDCVALAKDDEPVKQIIQEVFDELNY